MATFKYIGTMTKDDGTVTVKVPMSDGSVQVFDPVTPDVTVIDVGADALAIRDLENAVDLLGNYTFERVS